MVEKTFKIVSNLETYLTPELISEALLNYFTLDPAKSDAIFGVVEKEAKSKKRQSDKISLKV